MFLSLGYPDWWSVLVLLAWRLVLCGPFLLQLVHLMPQLTAVCPLLTTLVALPALWVLRLLICCQVLKLRCQVVNLTDNVGGLCLLTESAEIHIHNYGIAHGEGKGLQGSDHQSSHSFAFRQSICVILNGKAGGYSFKVMVEVYDRHFIPLFEGMELSLLDLPFCPRGCEVVLEGSPQLLGGPEDAGAVLPAR